MLALVHPFAYSVSSFFLSDTYIVPELKLLYVQTGSEMPPNVHSPESPGWGEQFVPIRAALGKCPVRNADTSSVNTVAGREQALNQLFTSPDTMPVTPAQGGRQP